MAFTEALRLVVDADTRGAVQGVERLGNAADRELGRSEKALDKWGNRLTSVGTGMVTFGVAAVAGLGAMAMASQEAELATLKLENTIQNMPKLAGASKDEFIDLAESIQKVTAADADAIVEGQALLGTFNLTAQEIKGITPLVVDYARKFGIDIPDAAIQVGKALDGQSGALKRNGVSIDEVLFKTDRYKAVSQALSDQVGGFAEAEGKTFAGSLERLKNQLGDLSEGVGRGAVDAFTTMGGAVQGLTERLNDVSPGTQELVGKIATFASVGFIAVGALNIIAGQLITFRSNISSAAGAVSSFTTKLGGIGRVAGIAAGAAGLAGLVLVARQLNDEANRTDPTKLSEALSSTSKATKEAIREFLAAKEAMGGLDDAFQGVLDTSVPMARQFVEVAESMGLSKDRIREWKAAIEEKTQTDVAGTVAQEAYSGEVEEGAAAMDGAAEATENAKTALQAYNDELSAQFDPLQAAIQSQRGLQDAAAGVTEAEMNLAVAVRDHGDASLEAMVASDELKRAQEDAGFAALDHRSNLISLLDAMTAQGLSVEDAKAKLYEMMIQSGLSAEAAGVLMSSIDGVTDAAYAIPERRNVDITVSGKEQSINDIAAIQREINNLRGRDVGIRIVGTAVGAVGGGVMRMHEGGVVPGRRGEEVAAILQAGERVIPLDAPRLMPAPTMGGIGGGLHVTVIVDRPIVATASEFEKMVSQAVAKATRTGGLPLRDGSGGRVRAA